ncbi:MAG TPA: sigma-70 family RNA polymerase sigma factor [Puia sp.]
MNSNPGRTPEELFPLFKEGDERAFKFFYELHHRPMFLFIRNFLRDDEVAEEVTNDVFIRLGKDRKRIVSPLHLEKYLYLVARHLTINKLVRLKKQLKEQADWAQYHYDWLTQFDDVEMTRDKALSLIYQYIHQLPERQQEIFILYFAKRMKVKSIAKLMNTSEKNVYKHLIKARQYFILLFSRNPLMIILLMTIWSTMTVLFQN